MIVIAFALPEESRDLVAALEHPVRSGSKALPVIRGTYAGRLVTVFHTGIGAASARERLRGFWEQYEGALPQAAIGTGFAGGLDPALAPGALILAENYPDCLAAARSRLGAERVSVGMLASASAVLETPEAKATHALQTGAIAVDMETATVAAFFREKGVPFLGLRAISDAVGDPLPVPSSVWFDGRTQRPRPLALVAFLLWHPGRIAPFARFVGNVNRARRTLTAALLEVIPVL